MVNGYIVAQISVTDTETYKSYVAQVGATVEKFGGEYIVRGGQSDTVEGTAPGERTVVIRFPSYQAAQDWYHSEDYKDVGAIRRSASSGMMTIVEGLE